MDEYKDDVQFRADGYYTELGNHTVVLIQVFLQDLNKSVYY